MEERIGLLKLNTKGWLALGYVVRRSLSGWVRAEQGHAGSREHGLWDVSEAPGVNQEGGGGATLI